MGKLMENEVVLRTRAKEVRSLIIEKQDVERAIDIIKTHEDILTFDYGRSKYLSLLPTIKLEKGLQNKYEILEKITREAVQLYLKNENYEELAFFSAAGCDEEHLHLSLKSIPEEKRAKTREGDTILLFFLKFANMENPQYIETLKILVNDYKLPVNQADYRDHSPIIILLNKFHSLHSQGITKYETTILNAVSVILNRNHVDLRSHKINGRNATDIIELYKLTSTLEELKRKNRNLIRMRSEMEDEMNVLFALLAQKNEDEFLKAIGKLAEGDDNIFDIDDGNNTLLQLACEKILKTAATYLIKQRANLSKTTERNRKTPLEISAKRNSSVIFEELLSSNKIVVDLELFTIFLLNRGRQIKTKYFDRILCYEGLQVDIAYENGNTPLHYAIIFENTEASLKLLKRGASLLTKNDKGKTPLDYISKEDLELYFDRCLLLDCYNKPHSKNYEMRFDFNGLLKENRDQNRTEVEVISKISSSKELNCLTTHPLIMAFLEAKWSATVRLYNHILMLYALFFIYCVVFAFYLRYMKFLSVFTIILLVLTSLDFKSKSSYLRIASHILFVCLVSYLIENKHIATCILVVTLMYQFLQQHLHFPRYQALVVNGIRKVTPHVILLFGLYYISNYETLLKDSKVILPVMVYNLIVTYAFNAMVDSVDVERSFKILYNKNTLDFIKFAEVLYNRFPVLLSNPFIESHFPPAATNAKKNKGRKYYLNYYLNRNKFVNECFHFLKLDQAVVKLLQDFVVRASGKVVTK